MPKYKARIALPARVFLWTIDQIAAMLAISESELRTAYLYFDGRSTGTPVGRMIARNIAPADSKPEWRISHQEFARWCGSKGYKLYEEGGFGG